jgi:hypothetical protein
LIAILTRAGFGFVPLQQSDQRHPGGHALSQLVYATVASWPAV